VITEDGTVIHHSNPGEVLKHTDDRIVRLLDGKSEGSINDRSREELIVFQSIDRTNWKIFAVIPYEKIAGSIDYVRNMTIFISVTALIIAVVLTYLATTSIVKRIAKLRQAMVITQIKNDFKFRAQVDGNDEVTDLSLSFNSLLGHLEQSVNDLAETRVQQHKAVVSALQSQINSHFLYNTLESISSMAVIYKQPDIGSIAVALSHMLRYTSDYKEWEVSLADEVRYTEDYLAIMKIRYGDDLTYSIDVVEVILPLRLRDVGDKGENEL
ncbi:sensor histidine kinase, partial [Paenibacillus sp. MCAF20]